MDTIQTPGQALHSDEADARSEAARMLGRVRSERKAAAARANGAKGGTHAFTEETRAKLRAAQQARRERERQARTAETPPVEKRPVGRPKTRPVVESAEKRPVGRPRKQATLLEE